MMLINDKLWYEINNVEELDSPVLVVYAERVKQNIKTLIASIDTVDRLRPHIKTHKSKEVIHLLIEAGIHKFKCATIAEAELLGISGAKDVLLAYQPYGPKLNRFLALIKKYPKSKFSCLVDNITSAQQMSEKSVLANIQLELYLDLNVGMNRTGVTPDDLAVSLYDQIAKLPYLTLMGLHAYDGHIYETDLPLRTVQCVDIYKMVSKLKITLEEKGFSAIKLIMGGSPSFPIYAKLPDVECSPGTFVFWDKNYLDILPEQKFLPAALVISRVISLPTADKICLDMGHKAIASENELSQRVYFLNAPDLELIGQSEEHLVAKVHRNHNYHVGDVLYGVPFHVCPTCALYSKAILIENNTVVGHWEIAARERAISI